MAVQVALNDLLEVKLYCQSQGQYSINTLHYVVSGVVGVPVFDGSILTDLDPTFSGPIKDCMGADSEYVGMSLQIIAPTRRPAVFTNASSGPGVVMSDTLPRQVAGLIRKKSSFASRHGRGRMYVPFPYEDANTTLGFPTPGYLTKLTTLAGVIDDPLAVTIGADTTTITPIILDRENGTAVSITECTVASTWATCRRRSDVRGADRAPF